MTEASGRHRGSSPAAGVPLQSPSTRWGRWDPLKQRASTPVPAGHPSATSRCPRFPAARDEAVSDERQLPLSSRARSCAYVGSDPACTLRRDGSRRSGESKRQHDCCTCNGERARTPLTSYTNYTPVTCHICSPLSLRSRQEATSAEKMAARERGRLAVPKGAGCESSPRASSYDAP